ncbi:diguanylate phosphodiesterase [Jeotgalicoccus coquinae]|uniref:Glutathione-binding protein GsiB n=1 Tax=Jeotgalicoccus coquinae TaxID=709509 RepID=A0A6V7RMZ2_9STAP|nr:glutathione ABC transporter substrate-binding protein [Jeotgalicoccus coquinae]MBB6422145.1 peptide/nickel transport system substrate-binding protein [Jeotgalicoccus coquinae]GGE18276.1 diguanylate phosphodiesterase [Jeotgalicoccus coquinae]CAD2079551.1 Glutathione-binding protein GsiB precursor [Jeotgalicoccus coquinae]
MAKKYFTYLLMAAMVIVLAACTDDSEVDVGDGEGSTEEASSGGDLVASYATDVSSLDPAGQNDLPSDQRRNVIYEGLLYLNDDLEPEPRLATDFEQTDDTTWVFNLREGVEFHDGTEFTAEAVKANIERIVDPAVASSRANIFEMIEEVNVIDDYTVEIVTEYPFAPLPKYLAHDAGGMVSKAIIDEDYQNAIDEAELNITLDEFYAEREAGGKEYEETADAVGRATGTVVEQKPVGTGYMKFQSRSPGENVVVERFDNYWDEPAKLDTITFKVVTEDASRIAELESGQSHFIQGFDNGQWERIEEHPEMETHPVYNLSNEYVGMNTQKGPLEDKRVRQAIGHMVDKETIMEGIYYGVGRTMKGALQEELLGYNEDLEDLEYDPERAKELLEEAGYGDGFEMNIMTNDTPERVDLAIYLQEELKEVGIKLNIEQLEWGAYLEAVSNGEHDLFILGWPNPVGDPDQGIWPLFHSSMQGAPGNRSFFDNAKVDELLEQGRRELDEEKRKEIYQEIDKILVEEQPAVFIRQSQSANAARTEVEGLYISHFNKPDFRNVTINEQ